jgi:hypothetical protein
MAPIAVTGAKYLGDFVLQCTFSTGATKRVDMKPLFKYPAYSELRDENLFRQFRIEETVLWSNGADIAPEWLYENGTDIELPSEE